MNGVYWGLTALHLLGHPDALPRGETISFVLSCQHESGGFGAAPGHDAHMLYTVSAIQILATVEALEELDQRGKAGQKKVAKYVAGLQDRSSGAFNGDEWGEKDTRFLFGAFLALSLLQELDLVDVPKAVEYVQACANFDGGFGVSPGAESHSGQIYTCLGALAIAKRLDVVDRDRLGGWLSERQLPSGGLNGRPEKLEDVCYSWWVVSSLAIIDRLHWIDGSKLIRFILLCQVSLQHPSKSYSLMSSRTPRKGASPTEPEMRWMSSIHTLASLASVCLGFLVWSPSILSSKGLFSS